MVLGQRASSDEELRWIEITSFDGGLNTELNPLRLALNESPNCQNVKLSQFGRLIGRDGWLSLLESLPAAPDGIVFCFDSSGARRIGIWSDGNLYDVTFGTLTLIGSGVYTAGNNIARVSFQDKVYWSDGAVAMRVWDPFAGTDAAVVASGNPGTINPPAFKVAAVYAGSIVVGAPTASATFEPHNIRWCSTNDPTDWLAVAAQAVAYGDGGEVNAIRPLGVADTGVAPTRTIFVGKSVRGCYGYTGALGSLSESILAIPAGVEDRDSVEFIEGPDGRGFVVFLGTDRKLWYTNGIQSGVLSKKIATYLSELVLEQEVTKSTPRFRSVVNSQDRQYILDMGDDLQLVYHYDFVRGESGQYEISGAWTKYTGWPSGYYVEGVDSNGVPSIYFAGDENLIHGQANTGVDDNGTLIDYFWYTPFLHGGNLELFKFFKEIYLAWATNDGQVEARATTDFGQASSNASATYTPDASAGGVFVLDESELDGSDVLDSLVGSNFTIYHHVWYPWVAFTAYGQSLRDNLYGSNVQLRFRQSSIDGHFELLGVKVGYTPQGRKGAAQRVVTST